MMGGRIGRIGWQGALVTGLLMGGVTAATAQERDARGYGADQRFSLRVGLFVPNHSTLARLDSEQLGVGTLIDLESDLGLEETTQNVRADAALRLGRRHQLRASYLRIDRSASTTLDRQIQWGDETFQVNADVASFWDMTLVPVNYRFAPVVTDQVDLGLSLGVFAAFIDAGLTVPSASIEEVQSVDFPLPVLGADVEIAPAPRVFVRGGIEYFGLKVRDIDGSWLELQGGVEYFPLRHLGLGVAYRYTDISVDTTGQVDAGDGFVDAEVFAEYDFKGPQFYVTLSL